MKKELLISLAVASAVSASAIAPTVTYGENGTYKVERNASLKVNTAIANTSAVKKVKKADEVTEKALFNMPDGCFYYGIVDGTGLMLLHAPSYVGIEWQNKSTGLTSSEWSYMDLTTTDDNGSTSTETNLVTRYGNSSGFSYPTPTLSINDGNDAFQLVSADDYSSRELRMTTGGDASAIVGSEVQTYPVTDVCAWMSSDYYDGGLFLYACRNNDDDEDYATPSNNYWSQWLQKNAEAYGLSENVTAEVKGIAQYVAKPARPYTLSAVQLPYVAFQAQTGAVVTLKGYKVDDEGNVAGEPFLTSTWTAEQDYEFAWTQDIEFKTVTDELTDDPYVIDSAIQLVVEFNDPKIAQFRKYAITNTTEIAEMKGVYNASVLVEVDDNGSVSDNFYNMGVFNYYGDDTKTWTQNVVSYDFYLTISYPEVDLHSFEVEDGAVSSYAEDILPYSECNSLVSNEGETVSCFLTSTQPAEEGNLWATVTDYKTGEEVDWVTVEMMDFVNQTYNTYQGYTVANLTAEALPAGVTGRSALVTFEVFGAKTTYRIDQGDMSGVETINVSTPATSVVVYDAAGRLVKKSAVEAANEGLNSGLYIMKYNNGTVAKKVVK